MQTDLLLNSIDIIPEIHDPDRTENGDIAMGFKKFVTEASDEELAQLLELNSNTLIRNVTNKNQKPEFIKRILARLGEITLTEKLNTFLRLIGHVRDIEQGKGERLLTYIMIQFLLESGKIAEARHIVTVLVTHKNHFGSWRDIDTLYEHTNGISSEFDTHLLEMVATQLRVDQEKVSKGLGVQNKITSIRKAVKIDTSKYSTVMENEAEMDILAKEIKCWSDSERQKFNSIKISLCAKWFNIRSPFGKKLANYMFDKVSDVNSRERYLRMLLSTLRTVLNVTECLMSAKLFGAIDPSTVPAKAMLRYTKVFQMQKQNTRNLLGQDLLGRKLLQHNLQLLTSGKSDKKIKSAGLQFYELLQGYIAKNAYCNEDPVVEAQAKEIIEEFKKLVDEKKFPICAAIVDVSGSMNGIPMTVAVSLGVLLANIMPAPWNQLITFETTPHLISLDTTKSMLSQVEQLMQASWGGSTNFGAALELVRTNCRGRKECLPSVLVTFSDMQFNQADREGVSSYELAKKRFSDSELTIPKMVFWNLRASNTRTSPVAADEKGVCMVSGFSQSLFKAFMNGCDFDNFTPLTMFKEIIYGERYNPCEMV